MGFYQGKKVFLSGGSKGIGRSAAVELARRGASVYVSARGQEALDETVAAMRAAAPGGDQVFGSVAFDVSDNAAVEAAAKKVLVELGGLDVLICNSGFAHCATTLEAPWEDYERHMDINFLGHVRVVRAFLPHFVAQKHGDICLVASLLGIFGTYAYGAYSASKFAIVGFAESLKQELMLENVRVSLFLPNTVDTPGLQAENADKPLILYALEDDSAFNKTYSADQAATALLATVQKGRFPGFIGWDSKLIDFVKRHLPGIYWYMFKGELDTAQQKVEGGWRPIEAKDS